jgi:hypothetical protein
MSMPGRILISVSAKFLRLLFLCVKISSGICRTLAVDERYGLVSRIDADLDLIVHLHPYIPYVANYSLSYQTCS